MELLGLFAKHWTPGTVKTRLARDLGDQQASQLYYTFLTTLLTRCAPLGQQRWLAFSPAERRDDFEPLAGSVWQLVPQGDGDLGARMRRFFERGFDAGAQRVLLIGSDSPTLPPAFIRQAFEHLQSKRVVLGPAEDGGYYLVGLSRGPVPPIFETIAWSSDQVWRQTAARLDAARIEFPTLPPWYDIDTYADLLRLHAELSSLDHDEPELAPLRHAVESAILP